LFSFLNFFNKNIPHAATIKQHIQTIGLTTNQAIHIVTNHTISVSHKAMIPVHTQMMFARKGRTFAKVSMNFSIAANPQYMSSNQISLIIRVIILFSFCAAKNMSSALMLPWDNRFIFLQFETL
jgi:hypothetical protein